MIAGDGIHVSVIINADRKRVFRAFTEDVARWWKGGARYQSNPGEHQTMYLEPRLGGRLLSYPTPGGHPCDDFDESSLEPFVVGQIQCWEPDHRLVLSWRLPNYAAGESTEVEICFIETLSADGGVATRVQVEHRGWAGLPPGHPATHGLTGEALTMMVGGWWRDLVKSLAATMDNQENKHER